jgi:hypothetical protein
MAWIGGAIAAGGAVLGGLLSSQGATSAADTQAASAAQAADVQRQMFNRTQANLAPWLQTGQVSLAELSSLLGLPQSTTGAPSPLTAPVQGGGVGLLAPFIQQAAQQTGPAAATPGAATGQFDPNAPLVRPFSLQDFQASPAYQFNLSEGQKAIDKAAASRGAFYQPGTLQDVARFSQGLASNEFQNAFSNYQTNMGNIWNRLYSLSGSGQNAAANLGSFGTTVAGDIGNQVTGAANARAAGIVGQTNALTGALGNVGNYYWMNRFLQGQQQPVVSQSDTFLPNV